ncbi:DUF1989 domain-containing protein [Paracoccus sp. DMF-8]|uniref:DUF1989 domain-containing protein n=1 Tax=Paracoccus sp. DMF-8 TaxID=3019445 RepID=UPI003204F0DD
MTLASEALFRAGPPRATRARRASAWTLAPSQERHIVPGRGAIVVEVMPGDRLEIVNDEGGQRCELLVAHPDGRLDPGILGATADASANGLRGLQESDDASLARVRLGLLRRGIDASQARAVGVFGAESRAGQRVEFTAQGRAWVIIAAPATPMDFEAQDTATPLTVLITRKTARKAGQFALPDPLADPVLDLRVHSATAESYVVRAGEFIQIMDVDGRQCTDFQCFDARKLDRGIVHPLDVTTTRTIQGHAYPDARPACEILRSGQYPAGRGHSGHLRASRCLCHGLCGEILR